ncbi:MAG: YceI family protein [Cyclobacteriaceae bacterium]|nr:hypothetical protein [Flammeovirgaceae bacterium]MDG1106793.1 YceI family protein [Cyclobacteriaceae bacterium]
MKIQLYTLLLILFLSISAHAQIWKIDPRHSSIMFNAKHSSISFVNGRFMEFEAKVEGGLPVDFSGARVSFKAQVSSISTGAEGRDKHLKTIDFLIWKIIRRSALQVKRLSNQVRTPTKW